MKIVITARAFTSPGPEPLRLLEESGHEIKNYTDLELGTSADEDLLISLLDGADAAVAGVEPYSARVLESCPALRIVSRRGIGYDAVDLEACRRLGITVARTAGAVEGAVAEHVMAYLLYFARRLDKQNAVMQQRIWQRTLQPGLKSHTLGLVGFGGIGREIARRAVPFGMDVLYYCRHRLPEQEALYGVRYAPFEQLLAQSDYVSVNVPLTAETRGLFGEAQFAAMKPGSIFVNISRGPIADTAALRRSLDSGHLSGAGLDVYDHEPCTDSPLVGCPNAVLTPHTASSTAENFNQMNLIAAQNVLDFLAGKDLGRMRVV